VLLEGVSLEIEGYNRQIETTVSKCSNGYANRNDGMLKIIMKGGDSRAAEFQIFEIIPEIRINIKSDK